MFIAGDVLPAERNQFSQLLYGNSAPSRPFPCDGLELPHQIIPSHLRLFYAYIGHFEPIRTIPDHSRLSKAISVHLRRNDIVVAFTFVSGDDLRRKLILYTTHLTGVGIHGGVIIKQDCSSVPSPVINVTDMIASIRRSPTSIPIAPVSDPTRGNPHRAQTGQWLYQSFVRSWTHLIR